MSYLWLNWSFYTRRLATHRNHNIVRQYFFELKEVKISGLCILDSNLSVTLLIRMPLRPDDEQIRHPHLNRNSQPVLETKSSCFAGQSIGRVGRGSLQSSNWLYRRRLSLSVYLVLSKEYFFSKRTAEGMENALKRKKCLVFRDMGIKFLLFFWRLSVERIFG